MLLSTKPRINLFAGWLYLFSEHYRREVKDQWETLPGWAMVMQFVAGAASILFPVIIIGMLVFVYIARHL